MIRKFAGRLALFAIAFMLLCPLGNAAGAVVPADGLYTVGVTSSSDMFRITRCVLRVDDGAMTAILTLSGQGYGYLYVGTGEEAAAAQQSEWVPYVEDEDGAYTYAIAIPALDVDTAVAAYSIRKSKWYDRTLNFQSGSLRAYDWIPKDGNYAVEVRSDEFAPKDVTLVVEDGAITAHLRLPDYDVMRIDGIEYAASDGLFSIPVPSLERAISVEACVQGGAWTAGEILFRAETCTTPVVVPEDGVYSAVAQSDSNLFPIMDCTLSVLDGNMTAFLTVESTKYESIFLGTAEEAMKAAESEKRAACAGDDASRVYAMPVAVLDREIPIATWSDKASKWYERTLSIDSASLAPASDAHVPSFAFVGGSGRVTMTCPVLFPAGEGTIAALVFSSANYTYAEVDGVRFYNENAGGDSTFFIPVNLDGATQIQAETTAMGDPHVVDYTVYVFTDGTDAAEAAGVTAEEPKETPDAAEKPEANNSLADAPSIAGLTFESELVLQYATCFRAYLYADGYSVISISDGRDYLVVPEGKPVPEGADANFVVLQMPLDRVYLAATASMCLFDAMDGLDHIRFSGTRAEDWYVENAVTRMNAGEIVYAGKYSQPDYEMLLSSGCDLAVESTMLHYAPEVLEKLEELGIPVWIDMSSYELEPLGRTEWIKAYAILLGRETTAEEVFAEQARLVEALSGFENTNLTVAYFYVNASGLIVTKPSSDYFARMVELAGGRYVFDELEGAKEDSSSITMDAESFYKAAKDADYVIYNAAVDTPLQSVADLVDLNDMFSDFKAVRTGNVFCTTKSLYQSASYAGVIISDLNGILTGRTDELTYLYQLD